MTRVSGRLQCRRLATRIRRLVLQQLGIDRTVYVDSRLAEYESYWRGAALLLGAEFRALSDVIWEVRLGQRSTRVSNYVVAVDDPVVLRMAGDKALCHRLAADAGAVVPDYVEFGLGELALAQARVRADAGPWVIKPATGTSAALGVTVGVTKPSQVERAAVLASLHSERLMLERMVPGESCRLLYLDGHLISAVRRRGARVIGDGRSTARELMKRAGLGSLAGDAVCAMNLRAQGAGLASVPAAGERLVVNGSPGSRSHRSELRTIYDEVITELVHPSTAAVMGRVVRALGSRLAGVDIITTDPARPLSETGGAFIELNTTPGIHHHYQTDIDRRDHPVATAVLRALLQERPPAARPRMQLVVSG